MPLIDLYRQPPCWESPPDSFMMQAMEWSIFCDILSAIGPSSRLFHLENCWAFHFKSKCSLYIQKYNTITVIIITFQSYRWPFLLLTVNSYWNVWIFWPTTSVIHQLCTTVWAFDLKCECVSHVIVVYNIGMDNLTRMYAWSPSQQAQRIRAYVAIHT